MIYDAEGIRLDVLKQVKEIERKPLTRYAELVSTATYTPVKSYPQGRNAVWSVPCFAAFPCATQNELNLATRETLLANGCTCVAEGANMPQRSTRCTPSLPLASPMALPRLPMRAVFR